MTARAAVTILGEPGEIERRWRERERLEGVEATASFTTAPGDRGTEVHVAVEQPGKVGQAVGKLTGKEPLAQVKDELRHFKQLVETGEVPRSEGSPEGETAKRKLKQHPAQPVEAS